MYNRRMKKIIILFLICFLSYSGVVRAEVETTENKAFMSPDEVREYMKYMDEPEEVQRAREAIFNGENKIVEQIDVSEYKDYFTDKKYSPNQKFRDAEFYSNGMYEIVHVFPVFFVYLEGKLIYISKYYIIKFGKLTKIIEYYYDINGILKYIECDLNENNSVYIFDKNKKYLYKRQKYKYYDKSGNLILKNRPYIPYK